jgi:hypothetical protein
LILSSILATFASVVRHVLCWQEMRQICWFCDLLNISLSVSSCVCCWVSCFRRSDSCLPICRSVGRIALVGSVVDFSVMLCCCFRHGKLSLSFVFNFVESSSSFMIFAFVIALRVCLCPLSSSFYSRLCCCFSTPFLNLPGFEWTRRCVAMRVGSGVRRIRGKNSSCRITSPRS